MSVPATTIYCTKCKFEKSYFHEGTLFNYTLPNGDKIYAPTGIGWCMACNSLVLLQKGLSIIVLKDKIKTLNLELKKLNKSFLRILSGSKKKRIKNIQFEISQTQKYLSVLNGKSSLHSCIDCGSTNVQSLLVISDEVTLADKSTYFHVNCGGQFKFKSDKSGIRIHYAIEEIDINPVQLPKTNSVVLDNDKKPNDNGKNLTTDDIPNFSFITDVINNLLASERDVLKNQKEKLFGFQNESIFQPSFNRHFLIERFLFIYSFMNTEKWPMDLELMKQYVTIVASKIYKISNHEASDFANNRIAFYKKELEMLVKLKHPHPGKIIYSLYNPSLKELTHDITTDFENNSIACFYLIQIILGSLEKEIKEFGYNRN